jgi:hypothetical protein
LKTNDIGLYKTVLCDLVLNQDLQVIGSSNCTDLKTVINMERPRIMNLLNNGSIHVFKSYNYIPKFTPVMGKLMPLTSKNYRLVTSSYPAKHPPYGTFKPEIHPLFDEISKLLLPVNPHTKSPYLAKEMWHKFTPQSKNMMVVKFMKQQIHSNIKIAVFVDDPNDESNHWLWIEVSEDSKIKVIELPTKRFLDTKPFFKDSLEYKNDIKIAGVDDMIRELCVYNQKFKDREGGFLVLLEDCQGNFNNNFKNVEPKILGYFELSNKWFKNGKELDWMVTYNRQDTYGVNIISMKTYQFYS